jgi:hypothetical protein
MSDVIHGTGKPRIVADDIVSFTDTVASATATTVTLIAGGSSDDIVGKLIRSETAGDAITIAKGLSYNPGTKVVTIDEWLGGVPAPGKDIIFLGTVIDLPYCEALIESFAFDQFSKKLYANGRIKKTKRGKYYFAILNYARFFSKENMEQVEVLMNTNQGSMLFYPRRDNLLINYVVDFPDDFVFQWQQRQFHSGHRLVIIQLEGLERLTAVDFSSAGALRGYGEDYADGMYRK